MFRAPFRFFRFLFGSLSLLVGLAALAAIPVFGFLTLGYLLEAAGRVGRSGRLRDGFFGQTQAAVLGLIAGTGWGVSVPFRFVAGLRRDAELMEAEGVPLGLTEGILLFLTVGAVILTLLVIVTVGHYWGRPLPDSVRGFARIRDGFLAFVQSLRLPHFFALGVRAWFGGLIWLAIPVAILWGAVSLPAGGEGAAGGLLAFLGVILLTPVAATLPFLQARYATTGRFADLFQWRESRAAFRRAPVAGFFALLASLALALPLYAFKVEMTPQEVAWLPALFFVLLIFPARLLTGWAVSRMEARETPRGWFWVWPARLLCIVVALAYGLVIWLMQYLSWTGAGSFLEQHAFLLPAPLL